MTDAEIRDFVTRFAAAWAARDGNGQLLDWSARGDVVIIEWQTTRLINGTRFSWRGVDKFRFKNGKIIEERVYCDTAPLRALRSGEALEPITKF
jgi:ketosteroid isomerase-like protein